MPELSGIYDSAPIQPIVRTKENLAIWTQKIWDYWRVVFQEGLPRSSQTTIEMITTAAVGTSIAANGTIPKVALPPLLLNEGEFLHLRWQPIDDVEGILWEQPSEGRFATRAIQARVDLRTHLMDPYLASTTFFLLGRDRLMNLEVRNPNPVIIFAARFVFWGFRYVVQRIPIEQRYNPDQVSKLQAGDIDTVRGLLGPTTWIPAEGR